MKRCPTLLIKEIQIEMTRYYFNPLEELKSKTDNTKCRQESQFVGILLFFLARVWPGINSFGEHFLQQFPIKSSHLDGTSYKESACQCSRHKRYGFDPWVRKISWSRKWQPAPVFLPGKLHGQRGLVGYSQWGCKESGTAEHIPYDPAQIQCTSFIHNKLAWESHKISSKRRMNNELSYIHIVENHLAGEKKWTDYWSMW